ncbi:hypothetical protein [Methylobacterium trifolii]|uniref:hypothetical protein n=1 Tax=Methylobacterium trifolii TaxID=1003092 RepID=UPI001EE0BE80|nr:hypothetical protein [Methylobacterium trifolii]
MEHVRSTIATTAFAVLGLVAAAHVLHPRDAALDKTSPARDAVLSGQASAQGAWVSPPARTASVAPASSRSDRRTILAFPEVGHPASFTLVTPDVIALPMIPETVQDAAMLRRRPVQVGVRQTPMVGKRITVADRRNADRNGATSPTETTPASSDPIGDLLKTLGLGQGREG